MTPQLGYNFHPAIARAHECYELKLKFGGSDYVI